MIGCVWSLREVEHRAHYDVVYEWEDSFSETLCIRKLNKLNLFLHRAYCKLFKHYTLYQNMRRELGLFFVMSPKELRFFPRHNVLPIFLDIWSDEDIDFVLEKTRKLKLFYVTSYAIYEKIKKKDPGSCVRYIPLSVSEKYYSEDFERYADKKIDVIQMGRNNLVLHRYMLRYIEENPGIEYVYAKDVYRNSNLEYVSTKRGEIGTMRSRKELIRMLSSAKVSLVSTPAMDDSRKNANGISFPTPRFYESAILGCSLIGRYETSREIEEIGISRICFNAMEYEEFAGYLKNVLSKDLKDLFNENREFIRRNLTSCRVAQIIKELNDTIKIQS